MAIRGHPGIYTVLTDVTHWPDTCRPRPIKH